MLSSALRGGLITASSPTFDEPFHVFNGVYFSQHNAWREIDVHPPFLPLLISAIAPLTAHYRDADEFAKDAKNFLGPYQYRLDLFSGLPGDLAVQRLRWALQGFTLLLAVSSLLIARHLDANRWAQAVLFAGLMLEPVFLASTSLVSNDGVALSLLAAATALGLASSPWLWAVSSVFFCLAWSTKLTAVLFIVPLALGLATRKLPWRVASLWLGGMALAAALCVGPWHYPFLSQLMHQPSSYRLSYLDGLISTRPVATYFAQALLCKTSFAGLALFGLAIYDWLGRRRGDWQGWVVFSGLLVAFVGATYMLPGIGIRLVLPLVATIYVAAALSVRDFRRALPLIALLALEVGLNRDRLIAYQNPLAGNEPRLLDSNRAWGQGLKQLAEWRAKNPDGQLALALFGGTLPEIYGLNDYTALPSFPALPLPAVIEGSFFGYAAVSENFLHGYALNNPSLKLLGERQLVRCFAGDLCLFDVRSAP